MTIDAWHFLNTDRHLAYPPYTLVQAGQTLTLPVGETVEIGRAGFHACLRVIDALRFAPGPVVCRVTLPDDAKGSECDEPILSNILPVQYRIIWAGDSRTCVWLADASTILHEFALWCGTQAWDLATGSGIYVPELPTECSDCLMAKQAYLDGTIDAHELMGYFQAARKVSVEWVSPHIQLTPVGSSGSPGYQRNYGQYKEYEFWSGPHYKLAAMWAAHPNPVYAARSASWQLAGASMVLSGSYTITALNTELTTRINTLAP